MKFYSKIFICIIAIMMLVVSLSSCIDRDRARGTIEDFFKAVEKNDFDSAKTYLHPDCLIDIKAYFDNVEAKKRIDFQSGVEILRYFSIESAHYDSDVDGSEYETSFYTKVGETKIEITVDIVDNDNGYGIYDLEIDIDD